MDRPQHHPAAQHGPGPVELTRREREIASLISDEYSNHQIAERLFLSVRTVENHVARIFLKLGVRSRVSLATWVQEQRKNVQEQRKNNESPRPYPPAQMEDFAGYDLKPDPLKAETLGDLEAILRVFWEWAGRPSSRKIAQRSGGAFSHTTVSKLLNDRPSKPPLKLSYVQGLIRGCRGSAEDEQQWVTAWRNISRSN